MPPWRSRRLKAFTASSIFCRGASRNKVTSNPSRRNVAAISVASLTVFCNGPTGYAALPMTSAVERDVGGAVTVWILLVVGGTEGVGALGGRGEAAAGVAGDGRAGAGATTGGVRAGGSCCNAGFRAGGSCCNAVLCIHPVRPSWSRILYQSCSWATATKSPTGGILATTSYATPGPDRTSMRNARTVGGCATMDRVISTAI